MFDMLPSPVNLFKWKISNDNLCKCGARGTLFHIISNCPLGLPRRYFWRHNQVLRVIADAVRRKLADINSGKMPQIPDRRQPIRFHREGQPACAKTARTVDNPEWQGRWKMEVDLSGEGFTLPVETRQKPDLVVFCEETRKLKFFELTVCWEAGMEKARLRKERRYKDLTSLCEEQGWETTCLPIEVGARGFVGNRTMSLLQQLGLNRAETKDLVIKIQEAAEYATRFIWNHRDDDHVVTN